MMFIITTVRKFIKQFHVHVQVLASLINKLTIKQYQRPKLSSLKFNVPVLTPNQSQSKNKTISSQLSYHDQQN